MCLTHHQALHPVRVLDAADMMGRQVTLCSVGGGILARAGDLAATLACTNKRLTVLLPCPLMQTTRNAPWKATFLYAGTQ